MGKRNKMNNIPLKYQPQVKQLVNKAYARGFVKGQKFERNKILEKYDEWYQQICKNNITIRQTPETIFLKIIKEQTTQSETRCIRRGEGQI